jgi:hypothetical protein
MKPAIKNAIKSNHCLITLYPSNSVDVIGDVQRQPTEALRTLGELQSKDTFVVQVCLDDCDVYRDKINGLYIVNPLFSGRDNGIGKTVKSRNIDSRILTKYRVEKSMEDNVPEVMPGENV